MYGESHMNDPAYEVISPTHMLIDVGLDDEIPPFPLIPVTQLTAKPTPMRWLIKGLLPEKSIIDV